MFAPSGVVDQPLKTLPSAFVNLVMSESKLRLFRAEVFCAVHKGDGGNADILGDCIELDISVGGCDGFGSVGNGRILVKRPADMFLAVDG